MEKKDYIERLILDNLEGLNNIEPPEGHFERFGERLRKESHPRSFRWDRVWKIAAAVVVVFLAVNQARIWLAPNSEKTVTLGSISPEFADVEYYYASSIRAGLKTIGTLAEEGVIPMEENKAMQEEFETFETRFKALQEDLKAHPGDDRVINAMIEYYQDKLNVITMILNKLQEVKKQKIQSHEIEM